MNGAFVEFSLSKFNLLLLPLCHSSTSEDIFVVLLVTFLEFSVEFFRFRFIFDWRIFFCFYFEVDVDASYCKQLLYIPAMVG